MLTDSHEILKKTKFIVFKPSQKRSSVNIQLLINGHKLDQIKETVFLREMLDENLNWKSEISCEANKVSKFVGIIRKFLPVDKIFTNVIFFTSLSIFLLLQLSLGLDL